MNSTTHPSLKTLDLRVHPNLLIRVLSNWLIGFITFFSVWALSYAALPPGSLQFAAGNPVLTRAGEALLPLRLSAWNLCAARGLVVLSSLFVVRDFPAGYLLPWIICALYGALLGTNSFALPDPTGPSAPNPAVLWTRAGGREISAYLLIAAALARIYQWQLPSWWSVRMKRVRSRSAPLKWRGSVLGARRRLPGLGSLCGSLADCSFVRAISRSRAGVVIMGSLRPNTENSKEKHMDKKSWLKIAAGLSFFMAICQTVISLSPAAAAYFGAPPPLLEDRLQLFLVGEGAALCLAIFGLYALSGAGSIRHLPLLRLGLIGVSSIYLLRGLFVILTVLTIVGALEGEIQIEGIITHLVFLAAGIAYVIGTALNWREMSTH